MTRRSRRTMATESEAVVSVSVSISASAWQGAEAAVSIYTVLRL